MIDLGTINLVNALALAGLCGLIGILVGEIDKRFALNKIKLSQQRYHRLVMKHRLSPVYFNAAPICPYCGDKIEVYLSFGLEDNDQWYEVECSKCGEFLWIRPHFSLTTDVTKDPNTTTKC